MYLVTFPGQRVASLYVVQIHFNPLWVEEGSHLLLCRSVILLTGLPPAVSGHRPEYDQGLMRSPITVTALILEYCSRSATLFSSSTRRRSFSAFWILRAFTSRKRPQEAFLLLFNRRNLLSQKLQGVFKFISLLSCHCLLRQHAAAR